MQKSIHGHDVLHFMLSQSNGFNKDGLITAIKEQFGENSIYHTCSKSEMSAEDLVEFLDKRGKFSSIAPNGFNTEEEKICNH